MISENRPEALTNGRFFCTVPSRPYDWASSSAPTMEEALLSATVALYFCALCSVRIPNPEDEFCRKEGHPRPEQGWSTMQTQPIGKLAPPKPQLFLSPDGALLIFPASFGSYARMDLDEVCARGTLTLGGRWKFSFEIPIPSGEVTQVHLVPELDPKPASD